MKNISLYIRNLLNGEDELAKHSQEVSALAQRFGMYLNYGFREVISLKIGGLIHDIGKILIPEDEEYEIVKQHALLGHQLLLKTKHPFSKDVLDIVLQHHERIDGKGYPYGLKDEEINPLTKIVTLCDVYSAMTSVRSYKNASSPMDALEEIGRCLGTQFDATLGRQFIQFIQLNQLETSIEHIKMNKISIEG